MQLADGRADALGGRARIYVVSRWLDDTSDCRFGLHVEIVRWVANKRLGG